MAERRAPLDRLIDLAVAVPTCSLVAVRRAIPLAARIGAVGTVRIVGRVSDAVHERRIAEVVEETIEVAETAPTRPDDDEPAQVVSVEDLPIDGYDDLAARQVVDRLSGLDPADLARVELYERGHRNRSTVLGKISMLTA